LWFCSFLIDISIEDKYQALKQAQQTRKIVQDYLKYLEGAFQFTLKKSKELRIPKKEFHIEGIIY